MDSVKRFGPAGGLLESPPYLWGDWRCNDNERFYTSRCPGCAGELWLNWTGDRWQVVCMNDERTCTRDEIEAGAARLLTAQRAREDFEDEAKRLMQTDDPFYGLPAEDYIEALTGRTASHGFVQCPFHAEGNERTPSLHVTGAFWYCQSCQRGGTIYDFGAHLWDLEPRRDGFKEIRSRLYRELLGVTT